MDQAMTALAFDTLKFAQTLKKGGFTPEQSEKLAEAFAEASTDHLARKSDLREMEMRLEAKIDTLRVDGLKWIVGAVGFQTLIMIGTILSVMRFGGH
jgi:hypothetical protein